MAILSSDKKSVTVVKGDTLWDIAKTYPNYISGSTIQARINTMVSLNNISNPDYIVVGQVIKLSGSATPAPTNNSSRAIIDVFGLQSNTDRTIYATWIWSKSNTKEYEVIWYYDTGDGVWFIGSDSTTTYKQTTYNAPSNAKAVRVKVKPVSKTYTLNNKQVSYWTASWSSVRTYYFDNDLPLVPPTPTVTVDGYTLTASLENLDVNATSIQFQVVKDNATVFSTGTSKITTSYASYFCSIAAGSEYKVRCRSIKNSKYSDWSDYSKNVTTPPEPTSGIKVYKATSATSVFLSWEKSANAETYEIEYTTERKYFDGSDAIQSITGIETTQYEKTGLESGKEYFFRIRSYNEQGKSGWSNIVSVVLGKKPEAPTTWASTTKATTGEPLTLHWVHNSEDGSSQTYAEIEITADGNTVTYTIKNSELEDEKDKTSSYVVDTVSYVEGTSLKWRVRTAGVTKEYGDWSIERTVDIYAPPTLEMSITDPDGNAIEILESYPFYVKGTTGPVTQSPIGYYLTVKSMDTYEVVDDLGNTQMIKSGDLVYSNNFDTEEQLIVELSANNLNLENNVSYEVTCVASMNSGLNAESTLGFTVSWTEDEIWPNAEVTIDEETLAAYIKPYSTGDYLMSIYRREYNGKLIEIATGLNGNNSPFVTDPHPSLDYARYRIVAKSKTTGKVSFYDMPGIPVNEKAIIIQWDEKWSYFDTTLEDEMEEPAWSGSMLKLPYNIDVADKHKKDVSLIEYEGREHPVSYYGTQLGETSTWNTEIPHYDTETLYALRRLSIWTGDVYVREPSGSGYWASIEVSFSQTHRKLTIPVSISVTRVEGGI